MRKIILAAVLAAAPAALSEIVFARQAIAQEPPAPTASGPDAAGASDLGGLSEEELEAAFEAYKQQFDASLTRRTGHVDLPVGFAALEVPDGYYYLDPQDASASLRKRGTTRRPTRSRRACCSRPPIPRSMTAAGAFSSNTRRPVTSPTTTPPASTTTR